MSKSIAEQLATVQTELEQMQNRLKILRNRKHNIERRERTHHLIERGAILESLVAGLADLTNEQVKDLLVIALACEEAKAYLSALGLSSPNP